MPAIGSVLLNLGKTLVASKLADKAVEHLAKVITAIVTTRPAPAPTVGSRDTLQAQIDGLRETVRHHERTIATLAATLEEFGHAIRPLIFRSAVTFWTALASVIVSAVALIIAIGR